jgi:hypothetical protein
MTELKTTPSLDEFLTEHMWDYSVTRQHYPYALPHNALTFTSSDQMARQLSAHGNSFFGASEMRIFRTRVDGLYNGRFLVFSNRHRYDGAKRQYHVMWVYTSGDENDPSACWHTDKLETTYQTLPQARKAAARLAAMVAGLGS